MPTATLRLGDCLEVMRELDDASVDAVVTDPPYGISFMGKHWDRFDIEQRVGKRDVSGLTRLSGSKDPGSSRHQTGRTSSGFANGASAAGQYDFTLTGARRFQETACEWATEWLRLLKPGGYAVVFGSTRMYHRLACGIEDAGFEIRDTLAWMFGQGFPKRTRECDDQTSTAFRVGGGKRPLRVGKGSDTEGKNTYGSGGPGGGSVAAGETDLGRWPANVILDEQSGALLDEQSGEVGAQAPVTGNEPTKNRDGEAYAANAWGEFKGIDGPAPFYGDRGGASRFFYCAKVSSAERHAGCEPSLFAPDAPERNDHPTVKPLALMRWLIRLVTADGAVILEPFAGSGSTVCAAELEGRDCIAIEREPAYMEITRARHAYWAAQPVEAATA